MKKYGCLLFVGLILSSFALGDIPLVHKGDRHTAHKKVNAQIAGTEDADASTVTQQPGLINCQVGKGCTVKPVPDSCTGGGGHLISCVVGKGCTCSDGQTQFSGDADANDVAFTNSNTNRKAASVKKTAPATNSGQ